MGSACQDTQLLHCMAYSIRQVIERDIMHTWRTLQTHMCMPTVFLASAARACDALPPTDHTHAYMPHRTFHDSDKAAEIRAELAEAAATPLRWARPQGQPFTRIHCTHYTGHHIKSHPIQTKPLNSGQSWQRQPPPLPPQRPPAA